MMKNSKKTQFRVRSLGDGFSVVEILTVIGIIGLLLGIVVGSVNISRQNSRDLRRTSDLKQIQLELALYHDFNRQYPANLSALTSGGYMSSLPTDPSGSSGSGYVYLPGPSNGTYCLGVYMERSVPSDDRNCNIGSYSKSPQSNYYEVSN